MEKSDWQPRTSVMPENSYTQKWDSICCEQNAVAKKLWLHSEYQRSELWFVCVNSVWTSLKPQTHYILHISKLTHITFYSLVTYFYMFPAMQ
jgi:hypothetical protein